MVPPGRPRSTQGPQKLEKSAPEADLGAKTGSNHSQIDPKWCPDGPETTPKPQQKCFFVVFVFWCVFFYSPLARAGLAHQGRKNESRHTTRNKGHGGGSASACESGYYITIRDILSLLFLVHRGTAKSHITRGSELLPLLENSRCVVTLRENWPYDLRRERRPEF